MTTCKSQVVAPPSPRLEIPPHYCGYSSRNDATVETGAAAAEPMAKASPISSHARPLLPPPPLQVACHVDEGLRNFLVGLGQDVDELSGVFPVTAAPLQG